MNNKSNQHDTSSVYIKLNSSLLFAAVFFTAWVVKDTISLPTVFVGSILFCATINLTIYDFRLALKAQNESQPFSSKAFIVVSGLNTYIASHYHLYMTSKKSSYVESSISEIVEFGGNFAYNFISNFSVLVGFICISLFFERYYVKEKLVETAIAICLFLITIISSFIS